MEPTDFTPQITELIGTAAIEHFKQTPEFQATCDALLQQVDSSYEQINRYLNLSVDAGISVETALTCASIYFKIKK